MRISAASQLGFARGTDDRTLRLYGGAVIQEQRRNFAGPSLRHSNDLCHNSPHSLSYESLTVRRVLCVSDPSYKLPRQRETPDPHLVNAQE